MSNRLPSKLRFESNFYSNHTRRRPHDYRDGFSSTIIFLRNESNRKSNRLQFGRIAFGIIFCMNEKRQLLSLEIISKVYWQWSLWKGHWTRGRGMWNDVSYHFKVMADLWQTNLGTETPLRYHSAIWSESVSHPNHCQF